MVDLRFEGFLKDIKIPIRLKEEDIPYDDFNTMAEKCTRSDSVGCFVKLSKEDLVKILEIAK